MYEFHYDYMSPKYGEKLKTRYMVIDRFSTISRRMTFMKTSLRMQRRDLTYADTKKKDAKSLPIKKSTKMVGAIKEQLGGKIMSEFVALGAKLCLYKQLDAEKPKCQQCQGISKCVVKKAQPLDDYKKCLDDGGNACREQILFKNKDNETSTSQLNNIQLN